VLNWAAWPRALRVALLAVCVLAAAGLAIAFIWPFTDLIAQHDVGLIKGPQRALQLQAARAATRTQLLTFGAGVLAAGALAFTAWNVTLYRKNLTIIEQGQVTDRYAKAIEQLGSDNLHVRIGGIYALQRIAGDSAQYHPTVMEVLTAFLREQRPSPDISQDEERSTPADVQAAVTVVGRSTQEHGFRRIELTRADLAGADLTGADLTGADLTKADLTGANLTLANFSRAALGGARMTGANLTGTVLTGAYLAASTLSDADLSNADLSGTNLIAAHLESAFLDRTTLTGADLTVARLDGATIDGADFTGADLTRANLIAANVAYVSNGANPGSVIFTRAILKGANLTDADLTNAKFSGADLTSAMVTRADLAGADLTGVKFIGATLALANLTGAKWSEDVQPPGGWVYDHGQLKRDNRGADDSGN
jgi:uncharacterized protein YjbI with pentapeptide repeats